MRYDLLLLKLSHDMNINLGWIFIAVGFAVLGHGGCGEKPTIADIVTTTIMGKVQDAVSNEPVAGASVYTQPATTTKTTGADGRYEITVELETIQETYEVIVTADGYQPFEKQIKVTAGSDNPFDVALQPLIPTTLSGRVTSTAANASLSGVAITTQPVTTATTIDADGYFSIEISDLTATTNYTFFARLDGHVDYEQVVSVTPHQDNPVDVVLQPLIPTTLSGRVTSTATNASLAGVTITTQPVTTATTTNADGYFTIEIADLTATTNYTLFARLDGHVDYEQVVSVSPNQDNPVDVTLAEKGSELSIPDTIVRIEAGIPSVFFLFRNDGTALLAWQVLVSEVPWLTVWWDETDQPGSFTGETAPESESVLVLEVHREKVTESKKEYQTTLFIKPVTGGTGQEITIIMAVESPEISVATEKISFGNSNQDATLEFANVGDGNLIWQLEGLPDWLGVNASEGQTGASETTKLTLSVDRSDLAINDYTATIELVSNALQQPRVALTVTMGVVPEEPLVVDVEALDFADTVESIEFNVTNRGPSEIELGLASSENWLNVSDQVVKLLPGETRPITASVSRVSLSEGSYKASIAIDSEVGNLTIGVSMGVALAPQLVVEPAALDFGETYDELLVVVSNAGTGQMRWKAEASDPWIALDPAEGTNLGETDTLRVRVSREGLQAGAYSANVRLSEATATSSVTLPLELLVVAANQAPIAEAGPDQQVTVNTTVTLDGSLSSDPDAEDGAILRYHWIVGAAPGGSVELSNSTAVQPTFIATEPGDYVFGLEVSDGDLTSLLDMVKVQVVDRIVSEQFGDVSISASIDETGDVSISASIDETTGDVEIEAEIDE